MKRNVMHGVVATLILVGLVCAAGCGGSSSTTAAVSRPEPAPLGRGQHRLRKCQVAAKKDSFIIDKKGGFSMKKLYDYPLLPAHRGIPGLVGEPLPRR